MTKKEVSFKHNQIEIAGELYLPKDFDESKKYPAIVVTHPGGGVKEQVAGLYADKLKDNGFITLTFDAAYQGQSGGEPRYLEDPASRVEDISCAINYLVTLNYVDENRIGALGICAGGGYTMNAVQTEARIKAAAGVSTVNFGCLIREGLGCTQSVEDLQKLLKEVGEESTKEARGSQMRYVGIAPEKADEITDDMPVLYKEGYDYYHTSRGCNPQAPSIMPFISFKLLARFDAFEFIDTVSPRPILLIAGTNADTLYFSQIAYDKAKEPKELFLIEGATHIDLYDKPQYVEPAVKKLTEFFEKNL